MKRSFHLFAHSTVKCILAILGILKMVVDRAYSVFPSDLPERPHKLGFKARLSQKLARSNIKSKSAETSFPLPSDILDSTAHATSTAFVTDDIRCSNALTTRNAINPSNHDRDPPAPSVSRLSKAISTLRLSKSARAEDTTPSSKPNDSYLTGSPPQATCETPLLIHRKPLPGHTGHIDLVERFERLRLPRHGKLQPSPLAPLSPALTATSVTTAQNNLHVAAETMAAFLPVLQKRPHLDSFRSDFDLHPGLDATQSVSESIVSQSMRPVSDLQKTWYSHSSEATQNTNYPQRNRRILQAKRRRSRSPSSSSEGALTPESSQDVVYPDLSLNARRRAGLREPPALASGEDAPRFLKSRDAALLQEHLDRRLAQQLQQEEDDTFDASNSIYAQPRPATREYPAPRFVKPSRQCNSNRRLHLSGTQDNPIDLVSDSDLDGSESDGLDFAEHVDVGNTAIDNGGPMDLDNEEDWSNDSQWKYNPSMLNIAKTLGMAGGWNCEQKAQHSGSTDDHHVAQTELDAELAWQLQEEEERNLETSLAIRECPVCTDSFPITTLPSLTDCTHAPQTCTICYAGWVAAQLEGSSWREAKCPESNCKVKLTYDEIQHIATAEVFEQYDTFITRTALNEDRKL
jgi:hypothetical protein